MDRRKSRFGLFCLAGALFLAMLPSVRAAFILPPIITDTLESVFTSTPQPWVYRFLFWLISFSILYVPSSTILFKQQKTIAWIVPCVISLSASLLLPQEVVDMIFKQYSMILALVLFFAPIIAIINLMKRIGDHGAISHAIKAIVFAITGYLFFQARSILDVNFSFLENVGLNLIDVFTVGGVVLFVLAVFQVIAIFGGGSGLKSRVGNGEGSSKVNWETVQRTLKNKAAELGHREDQAGAEGKRIENAEEHWIHNLIKNLDEFLNYIDKTRNLNNEYTEEQIENFFGFAMKFFGEVIKDYKHLDELCKYEVKKFIEREQLTGAKDKKMEYLLEYESRLKAIAGKDLRTMYEDFQKITDVRTQLKDKQNELKQAYDLANHLLHIAEIWKKLEKKEKHAM
ncbi:MAG: hypothetical protein V1659_02200 [Candidatus Woesearchaeota archaeon]